MEIHTKSKNARRQKNLGTRVATGLGTHFALLTGIVLLLALLLVSGLSLYRQQHNIQEELREKGLLLGHFVATISPEAIYSYDFNSLNELVKKLGQYRDISYSLVVDAQGKALTSFLEQDTPLIQEIMQLKPQSSPISVIEQLRQREDLIHLVLPITHNAEQLGEVWIGISTERSIQLLKDAAKEQLWFNLLLIFCISVGVLIVFRIKVLNPVHDLMQAAHRTSAGQFEYLIPIRSRDEFGSLAENFNFMIQAVQQNNENFNHMIEMLQVSMLEKDQALFEASEQNWLNEGIRLFVESMHSSFAIDSLASRSVENLSTRLDLAAAILYTHEGSDLHKIACSVELDELSLDYISLDEYDILEQIKQEHQPVLCQTRPLLTQTKQADLLLIPWVYYLPLLLQGSFIGLLELGFMTQPKKIQLAFLAHIANHLAISLYASQQQQQTQQALQITQEKTRQLEQKSLELHLAMEETERATKAKSVFLANMSHELRTPLNAILGFSEMILEDLQDVGEDAEMIDDMRKIHHSGQSLLSLVNDVLDISKIESGKMDVYIEYIDLNHLLSGVMNTIAPLAEKNHCPLVLEKDSTLNDLDFYADLTKVRQVLLNLLSNAVKFCENKTVQLLVSSLDQMFIEFRVQDQGIGISAEKIESLFQAFTQADASTTRKYGGTGLGLTICKEFVEMMGGVIEVESTVGQGSCFIVRLPLHVQKPEERSAHKPTLASGKQRLVDTQLNSIKENGIILVVDDDHEIRQLLSEHLEKLGYHPVTAASGEEALSLVHKLRPDAITLDVMMPDMDGWAVLTQLKSDAELMRIPVIMLSIIEDKAKGYALGATEYLVKPAEREELSRVLRKYREDAPALVMLVEDDETTRSMMCTMLERIECNVITAENGKIALQRLQQHRPDVILLDLMMPEMSGLELAQILHQHPLWHNIPIIVLTEKDLTPEERRDLAGCVEIIYQKGNYQRVDLLQQIQSCLTQALQK